MPLGWVLEEGMGRGLWGGRRRLCEVGVSLCSQAMGQEETATSCARGSLDRIWGKI